MTSDPTLWTLEELGAQVALALAVDYNGAPNHRVRDVPDVRTIRYYTTLGLLDRPTTMRGRTALYGRRHLLQLAAIKRLQTRGLTLAEIQQQLLGLADSALEPLARLPSGPATPEPDESDRAASFWRTALPEPSPAADSPEVAASAPADVPIALQGIPLADAVTLLLAAERPLEPDDIAAIRTVAAPLLKLLQRRRLLGPRPERDSS